MSSSDLDQVGIASPCSADWDAMHGDERVRFCGQCELNVYNLSAMGRQEAESFVQESEGKVCIRMYKRQDGTLITQDCPVGLRAILRRKLSWLAGVAASLLATVGGLFVGASSAQGKTTTGSTGRALPVVSMGSPQPEPVVVIGDMAPDTCEPPLDVAPEPPIEHVLMGGMVAEPLVEMGEMIEEPPVDEPQDEPQVDDPEDEPVDEPKIDEPRPRMGRMARPVNKPEELVR